MPFFFPQAHFVLLDTCKALQQTIKVEIFGADFTTL